MTPDDVLKAIREIETLAAEGDDEAAHAAEDALYRQRLEAVATGAARHPQACARLALESQGIRFARRRG